MVITLDFESNNPGSIPGGSFHPAIAQLVEHLIVAYLKLNNTINLVIKTQIVPCSIHGGWISRNSAG